jgi:hypothetical protein
MPYEVASYVTVDQAIFLDTAGNGDGTKGTQVAQGSTTPYYSWDAGKTRGCVCDATYGDVDCSKRMCPYGTDVLDVRMDLTMAASYQVQELVFVANDQNWEDSSTGISQFSAGIYSPGMKGQTFALTFRSRLNETFTTIPIVFDPVDLNDFVHDIQVALLSLPNRVIDGITVAAGRYLSTALTYDAYTYPTGQGANVLSVSDTAALDGNPFSYGSANNPSSMTITRNEIRVNITFTGPAVQGPQHLIEIQSYECQSGCTPKLTGLQLQTRANHLQSNVTEIDLSDFNSYECGRRGKCDYSTGLCACFLGYTGDNCNTLSTLV